MQEPIEQRDHGGSVSEQLPPVVHGSIGGQERRDALVAAHDQFEEIFGGGVGELAHAEVIDLCGAPHKGEHFLPGGAAHDRSAPRQMMARRDRGQKMPWTKPLHPTLGYGD